MIKKIAIACFVALTFVIYSIHQRGEGAQAVQQVIAAKNNSDNASTSMTSTPASNTSTYKNGTYTGKSSDAFYGYVQVQAIVSNGKLAAINILDYPQDRRNSVEINNYALPQLEQQAIQAQSAQVDGVSGATDTSQAFIESLSDALSQAKA